MVTPLTCRDLSWSLTTSWRISIPGSKPRNWSYLTSISCGVWWWLSTVQFMREYTIPPNWTTLLQWRSKSGAQENIDLKDNCFTLDLEEDTIETPTHVPRVTPESPVSEGESVSEVIKRPISEGVQDISNFSFLFCSTIIQRSQWDAI